ncbi:hypothetical protein C8R44DRAFT_790432 [Mycena epipterygia]|nr:hypothetical protein C8R44DRAFT_790432 [Mycena epipterygia]
MHAQLPIALIASQVWLGLISCWIFHGMNSGNPSVLYAKSWTQMTETLMNCSPTYQIPNSVQNPLQYSRTFPADKCVP